MDKLCAVEAKFKAISVVGGIVHAMPAMAASEKASAKAYQHADTRLATSSQRHSSVDTESTSHPLPSFSSLNRSIFEANDDPPAQGSARGVSFANSQSLVLQVQARDQTIFLLRREQDRLSRLHEQLVLKNQLVDRELALTQEEKARLKKEAGIIAEHADELKRENERLRNQAQVQAAQWQQILERASRLEIQSREEVRRIRAEREAWLREKENLEQQLHRFQHLCLCQMNRSLSIATPPEFVRTMGLSTGSYEQLRNDRAATTGHHVLMNGDSDSSHTSTQARTVQQSDQRKA